MQRLLSAIIALLALGLSLGASERKTRVACVGNSITFGYGLSDPAAASYPSRLQEMLGPDFIVGNFGHSGATLLRRGHRPYNELPEYRAALDFRPDVAVIHLGVNDTDPRDYPEFGDRFVSDYVSLIDSLRAVNPEMRIIIANLTPIGAQHFRFRSGTRQWLRALRDEIPRVAQATGAELIDFDLPLRHRQNLMPDGIHPNAEGYRLLAETVRGAITGQYGGLQLPAIYQDGMIVQRDRFLPIEGTADAGSEIAVTVGSTRLHTRADNLGRWSVIAPPQAVGAPFSITISDGRTSRTIANVLAGEVWIASGQSNMEFKLAADSEAARTIPSSADPLLRFYSMDGIHDTYAGQWPDSITDLADRLEFYRPARWQAVGPDNAGNLSAVAYYFARQLRDSLQVPVGIIANPVGGVTTESWIDVTTLEDSMPEVLVNWLSNDYVQKWAQQRAAENLGKDRLSSCHPFRPAYLFAAGILPLAHLPARGAIWYQGESNAHNTTIHSELFPLLLKSWRNYFGDPGMPLIYAQLSSIDRPSWPMFRDSQRRMEHELDNVYMAVTSDVGDSLDVHPRKKCPVGERMARRALHNIYGFTSLPDRGPEFRSARRADAGRSVILTFSPPSPLATADGRAPITFELAAIDGLYTPARAEIISENEIKLSSMDITEPRFVRYGWQPFTRANLINADSLPASTFKAEIADLSAQIEPGLEVGISAPFAAFAEGKVIMAGGCNFPVDPMGPASQKKFYRGIYAADPATMQWQRIGSLPEASAYGATATLPSGIALIGGTPEGQPTSAVTLMKLTKGPEGSLSVEFDPLPSLPCTLDNMAATAIGETIYVAGGSADGVPSNLLYSLNTARPADGWKALRPMPGNPRVQPVMAAAKDASGETVIYLWGGFAGKHKGHEASLELSGLKYSPARNRWEKISGPVDASGDPLSVGGGCAAVTADGRIAIAGGVNKDVFLEALRNQAPDYLQHPIEWYRFNPNVLLFDPQTSSWQILLTDPMAARAGAAMVSTPRGLVLLGGELKPRIRTAETLLIPVK